MTIYGVNMDGLGTDSRQEQIRRALFGAFYGFLSGLAFVFVAAYVDIWLNPDLPFGVDWGTFGSRVLLIGVGLALVGAVTCWWHEAWQGLICGAAVAAVLALIAALFSSQTGVGMKFVVLVFILMPIAAMTLPIAWVLRWVTERHALALQMKWSSARIAALSLLVVIVGAGCGYFMKTAAPGLEATRVVNELLQHLSREKNPINNVVGVQEHAAVPYKLYSSRSKFSTEGFDIKVKYQDGFSLLCTVIVYPERDPFLSACEAGR